jgi:hypothetical protein
MVLLNPVTLTSLAKSFITPLPRVFGQRIK